MKEPTDEAVGEFLYRVLEHQYIHADDGYAFTTEEIKMLAEMFLTGELGDLEATLNRAKQGQPQNES